MILAAVPKVDVVPDGFDWANLIAGFGGLAVALVALVLARRAQRTADEAATDERRRLFELEILRDLTKNLDEDNLATTAFTEPKALAAYQLRLGLLSSRLPFWDQVMAKDDVYGVMAAVGSPEFESIDRRLAEATDDVRYLSMTIQLLPILNQQSREAGANMIGRISKWVPDHPDQMADPAEWQPIEASLTQTLAELKAEIPTLAVQKVELRDAGKAELRRRLAWDVEQAILSRVEARRPRRPRWWFRV